MPKPFGMTARGKITRYLRETNRPETFSAAGLASRFKTSAGNVRGLLAELEGYGWQVQRNWGSGFIIYKATPPASLEKEQNAG